jgi:hypothetical protein
MAELAAEQAPAASRAVESAVSLLRSRASAHAELAARAASGSWMPFRAAVPTEPLDTRLAGQAAPRDYCIASADGSHVEPDRHGPAVCYLLNVGAAVIRYGRSPAARLASAPFLGYKHEDLYISGGGAEVPVQDRVLALKRHIEEMRFLCRLAVEASGETPVVALSDGTLLVSAWGQGDDSQVLDVLVSQFLECLEELKSNGIPVASYISRPRGSDVVNLLRLAACPYGDVECSTKCRGIAASATPCAHLAVVADRQVFDRLPLDGGERSAVFVSSWATSRQRYGVHKVHFFYLHVGSEIARVEVPEWVALDPEALARTQAVVLDQAARGQGYPRSLIEAHEKAVLTGNDRRAYSTMVEQALSVAGVRVGSSLKGVSKSVGQY